MSPLFLSAAGWVQPPVPETLQTTAAFKNSLLGRQSDMLILEENRGSPQNSVQMSLSYFISFFLSLIFFQFNYSTSLINRYDCRACNLCARHLICSGSWCRGALAGIVFFLFHDGLRFRSAAADLIILSQRGI